MRKLKIGIAYEGGNDSDVLLVLIGRIVSEKQLAIDWDNIVDCKSYTVILKFLGTYIKKFEQEEVDLAVFCTDQDREEKSRRKEIRKAVERKSRTFLEKCIIAVPDPHIEDWLLLDDGIVKKKLGINGSCALPYKEKAPKDRFMQLYNESNYLKSQKGLRIEIAQEMNIDLCASKSPDFLAFIEDVKNFVRLSRQNA